MSRPVRIINHSIPGGLTDRPLGARTMMAIPGTTKIPNAEANFAARSGEDPLNSMGGS